MGRVTITQVVNEITAMSPGQLEELGRLLRQQVGIDLRLPKADLVLSVTCTPPPRGDFQAYMGLIRFVRIVGRCDLQKAVDVARSEGPVRVMCNMTRQQLQSLARSHGVAHLVTF